MGVGDIEDVGKIEGKREQNDSIVAVVRSRPKNAALRKTEGFEGDSFVPG